MELVAIAYPVPSCRRGRQLSAEDFVDSGVWLKEAECVGIFAQKRGRDMNSTKITYFSRFPEELRLKPVLDFLLIDYLCLK